MSKPTVSVFEPVRTELNFPADEAKILAFWKANDIFQKTLRAETRATGPSKGPFVFYEGPPTANGMPHNGHVLTRAVKDIFPRYKTMCGYDVPRKAGWDTHGLPVEVEVEKELRIHGKADIEKYGVRPFIAKCIDSVFRYTEAWEKLTDKIAFWADLDDAYVTYHRSFVESVWWALAELFNKGLLYQGHRVAWWWPQGGTALSAAEVGWNYKTVDDPSVFVAFQLVDEDAALLAWTTTPWTLPSNAYAAVRKDFDYVLVDTGIRKLYVAKALREELEKKIGTSLAVVRELKGEALIGKRYRPPFDTYAKTLFDSSGDLKAGGSRHWYWRVVHADFVTLDKGSGIVHSAPAFGEVDFDSHKAELAQFKAPLDIPLLCAVNPDGTFTELMGELAGTFVKKADTALIKDLEARGLLVHKETLRHAYPFCWRADDDPLIQLARPAWYIRTTDRIQEAIANNKTIQWLPEHIQEGRFGDFLNNNVDWSLSRERFWGTPLNIWTCERDVEHRYAPTSVKDIEALNPKAFDHFYEARRADPTLNEHLIVHKPWIDEVTFPCKTCGGVMRRAPEVIDCWFDSGAMPFAQWGFPHVEGSKEKFAEAFPADFISEAIDQTRGWFYSLLMVSTLVFDEATQKRYGLAHRPFPHPYKTCVVLGLVCDKEGKKESKSKGNYTSPEIILERVRMEFATIDASLVKGLDSAAGIAWIAREDYEGLDLTGEQAQVELYGAAEAETGGARARFVLKPTKALPRRIVALQAGDLARLGSETNAQGLDVMPNDVFRLPKGQRMFVEDPGAPAPGADAFRWFFYAASPSWSNTRHSLTNVRQTQKEFLIKLRNVYSFFTIYAGIDGFNPARGNAQAKGTTPADLATSENYRAGMERSELDRWILSEVALTVREVRKWLDGYRLYEAAQALLALAEAVSNWYVRRSRERFWAPVATAGQDKHDAYWTLYEVLVATTKLMAPFTPYFAEEMYQNLVRSPWPTSQPESVHVCLYPEVIPAHVNESLAREMAAVRELVSLGLQVRTQNKLRVRQPLSQVDVVVSDAGLRSALERHAPLLTEELNVKVARFLKAGEEGQAVKYQLKPNFRSLGPKVGKKVQAAKKALAEADAGALRTELALHGRVSIAIEGETLELTGEDIDVQVEASEGFAAAGGRVGVVVLHTALTPALLDEGLVRELISRVQAVRKEMNLDFVDRIALTVGGSERVGRLVREHQTALEGDCLAVAVKTVGLSSVPDAKSFSIEGESVEVLVEPVKAKESSHV